MLLTLIKIRFKMTYNNTFNRKKDKDKGKSNKTVLKTIGMVLLILYMAAVFFGMAFALFNQMCVPFNKLSLDWFYFVTVIITSFVLMFIGTIFTTQSQIYESKDNDLLISMPINPGYILASRVITLLIMSFAFEIIICIPALVAYCINIGITLNMGICFAAVFICLPFVTLSITCIIAGLLEIIGRRIKNKSIIITVMSIIFFVVYMLFINRMNKYIAIFIANGESIAGKLRSAVAPLYYMGQGIANGNFLYIGIVVLVSVLISTTVYIILSKNYINMCTNKRGFKKTKYKEKTFKVNSITNAIMKKDLVHFYKSPAYMLNGAMGIIFVIAIPIILIVKRNDMLEVLKGVPQFEPYVMSIIAAGLAMVNMTNIISAPSISLEGRSLWILRSMPISSKEIIDAKIRMHLLICIPPTIIAQIAILFMISGSIKGYITLFLLPISIIFLMAVFGVMVNLKHPKMEWVSETVAVKQSASTMIAVFSGMGFVITIALLYGVVFRLFMNIQNYLLCSTFFIIIITVLMYKCLIKKGTKLLERI